MNLFGEQIDLDPNSPRYYLWSIVVLSTYPLFIGVANVLLMMALSFSFVGFISGMVVSALIFIGGRLYFIYKANQANATVNQMVSSIAYNANDVDTFEKDLLKDNDMMVFTAKVSIAIWAMFFSLIVVLTIISLLIFVADLPIAIANVLFFLPWNYMAIELIHMAESIAKDDFTISLRGALLKLWQMDTLQANPHRG